MTWSSSFSRLMNSLSFGVLILSLSLISTSSNNKAFADPHIFTQGDTVVFTNKSRQNSSPKRSLHSSKRSVKVCSLEDLRTGEQSLITAPTRAQLKKSNVIWCQERPLTEEEANLSATSSDQATQKKTSKTTSKTTQIKKSSKRSLPQRAEAFRSFVEGAAQQYQVPQELLWAFMKVESDFIPTAVSRVGAQGLMQLMPFTSKDMGVIDPFDPEQNIYGAAKLISILMKRFKNELPLVISAYHAGGGAVTRQEGIPYEATSQYMTAVLNAYYRYKKHPPYLKE